jgi:arylsulfatase A-like enzyme
MKAVKSQNARRPFFAYITPNAPHAPLNVPESLRKAVRRQASRKTESRNKYRQVFWHGSQH